jgi:hypothetical protein
MSLHREPAGTHKLIAGFMTKVAIPGGAVP